MARWEYKTYFNDKSKIGQVNIVDDLDALGSNGWELVLQVQHKVIEDDIYFIFKRERVT